VENWIRLAQDRVQWQVFVNTVMNLRLFFEQLSNDFSKNVLQHGVSELVNHPTVELYIHSPNTPSWRGAQLKHGDSFTFLPFT